MEPMTYFAKRAVSDDVDTLLYMLKHDHYPWKRRVGDFFRKATCFFFGHKMDEQLWTDADGNHVYHFGCTRCPHFEIHTMSSICEK